ncbi:hypothetical protein [Vibrio porteresiae]|uniref:DUF2975 domain-containing protein n=1 Tax=Vibrio porteresiae DSM 19223 TaxID=1123496 RepID=A0ABZ0Q9E6_9VIBR|nr:hypothetical protein [Vibrio porteresiae]WPC72397.1 hypothetical protein R8Z52_09625 [Vibrio porteresiae DSM 19223]
MEINKDQKVSSRVWQGIKFAIKWLWLITMFLLGIAMFVLLPSEIFEYSYSLSELDLIEELYLIVLVCFIYKYIKLCLRLKAPFVRKLITPFVYQAYLCLFSVACALIAYLAFDASLEEINYSPMINVFSYVASMIMTAYSYHILKYSFNSSELNVDNSANDAEISQ